MLLLFCCLFSISCPWIASFSCGNKINQLRITQRTYNHLRNTGYALQLLNKIQAYCVFRLESRCSNYHHDIMNASEHAFFSDESDCAFVQRRPADSVHPIRVAMLEFDIPDKLPNPTNFLESKVWQRENEIEILRERFTLPRAISLAKSADQKDQRRDFLKAIRDRQKLTVQVLSVVCAHYEYICHLTD